MRAYRAVYPERIKKSQAKTRKRYIKKTLARNSAYRARKLKAGGSHTADDVAEIRSLQKDRCANPACRTRLKGKGHVDHIVALTKGGTDDRKNLQLLCPACNSRKRNHDPIDFMQSLGFLL